MYFSYCVGHSHVYLIQGTTDTVSVLVSANIGIGISRYTGSTDKENSLSVSVSADKVFYIESDLENLCDFMINTKVLQI